MGKHVITRYINISTLISRHKFKTICPKAVRGEAPPHKDNLIGSATGGGAEIRLFKTGHQL